MKKLVYLALTVLLTSNVASGWEDCPFGYSNDPYPGLCGRYVDSDGDGICDHSQPAKTLYSAAEESSAEGDAAASANAASISQPSAGSRGYDFLNLAVAMLIVYGASFALYRMGVMTVRTHRMIWNVLLLFTFIVCGGLGVLLILKINYGLVVKLPLNMLYWHVEAGVAMTLISTFHVLWHIEYFKCVLGSVL